MEVSPASVAIDQTSDSDLGFSFASIARLGRAWAIPEYRRD